MALSWENDESVQIYVVYLNTDIEHVAFGIFKDRVEKYLHLQDIVTTDSYAISNVKSMEIVKEADTLSFLVNGAVFSTLQRANLSSSVSLGLVAKGEGKASFTFSFSQE